MRIVFMGTPKAAVPSLKRLIEDGHEIVSVWTQPDKPAGRGELMHEPPVKDVALANQIEVKQPEKIRIDEAKDLFASYDADLGVVVAYGRILPKEYLGAPKHGCINVHFSLLPKYRGAAPTNWAIVNGERTTGVTTMFVEEELDAGPILIQKETAIGVNETAPELMDRLSLMGAELLSETVSNLDELIPRVQLHQNASFAPMLTKADGIIKWTEAATNIERAVRGFQPWPNAYTQNRGKRVIIWAAEPVETSATETRPGEVIEAHGEGLIVKAGEGTALKILELQPESKRRMSVRDFLNGTHLQAGESFG